MATPKTRNQLQRLFKSGDKPSEDDFKDLINAGLNIKDDGIEKPAGTDNPLKISVHGEQENVLDLYTGQTHAWRLNQKPIQTAQGLNLETASGVSKLFLESSSGNLGLGTVKPIAKVHIQLQDLSNQHALRIDDEMGDTTPLVVNADGNVGIGTDDPTNQLEVKGNTSITGTLSVAETLTLSTNVLRFTQNGQISSQDNTHQISFQADHLELRDAGKIVFSPGKTGDETKQMILDEAGDLTLNGSETIKGDTHIARQLQVTGDTSLAGALSVASTANLAQDCAVSGQLNVTGETSLVGALSVASTVNLAQDCAVAGALTVSGGINVAGNTDLAGALNVTGDTTLAGALSVAKSIQLSANQEILFAENGQIKSQGDEHRIHFNGDEKILELREKGKIVFSPGETDAKTNQPESNQMVLDEQGNLTVNGAGTINGILTASKFIGEGAFVVGMIMMWSGKVSQIPTGWALCDGKNDTPDLTERFIVGAGASAKPDEQTTLYDAGDEGEPDSHSHKINPPKTTTNEVADHTHKFPEKWYRNKVTEGTVITAVRTLLDTNNGDVKNETTQGAGSHSHTVDVAEFTSGNSSGLNRPKWYALCFIIKI
ncbi:MAG: tail fiber protein [Spirulina sp. SIO3F2]|nr:tail fiber protein [Spirulina sp. SIO3F2]